MKTLLDLLMLSCKKASELIDKQLLLNLSLKERLMLKIHTRLCEACFEYEKQSKLLDKLLLKHISTSEESQIPIQINIELKQKIIHNINPKK